MSQIGHIPNQDFCNCSNKTGRNSISLVVHSTEKQNLKDSTLISLSRKYVSVTQDNLQTCLFSLERPFVENTFKLPEMEHNSEGKCLLIWMLPGQYDKLSDDF